MKCMRVGMATGLLVGLLFSIAPSTPVNAADKRTPAPELGALQGREAQAFHLGVNAVMWGYPAVFFEDLMRGRTPVDAEEKTGNPRAQVNQFGLVRNLRGPEFKQIATPNNDTLYAQAFCDVSREPLVLTVPAVEPDRYYVMQLWDVNGDTFGHVGSRATGREAGHYALVGPGWKGELPAGVKRIDSEYNNFAIWGRIGVNGPDDVENARAIQDKLRLTPLSHFGKSEQQVPPDMEYSAQRVAYEKPADLPEGLEFYDKLAHALKHTPPKPAQDAVVADSLAYIGFRSGNTEYDYKSLTEPEITGLKKAYQFALHVMDVNAQTVGVAVNNWRWNPKSGIMGTDYLFRAAWAKWYTGGNASEEAIYMDGRTDDKGEPFDGSRKYTVRFEKGQTPHVSAFWSLSMYHLSDGSFIENPIKRYSIGDRTPGITTAGDDSLTIYIQHDEPTDPAQKANWLPAPEGGFYMNLRLYGPDDSLKNGTWAPPPVTVAQ
ncbi:MULTISPECIES: DUF1254 domain-containing protein [unclassified Ensifer]|uniref:DUF1254 domain-containing protein n=1 Tax=unclassified Ensifer TaxID=2633371 RepID=UPI00081343DB|nr:MULTISPECIES: DUF1254 domain-containing protein [unclassified Ensifer]OCP21255.1 hypothetical protein BC363_28535 [Ensifer sp. LC384]OCP21838.1 hypothetical protein BC361_26155 [Ensifer sp. LC54]